MKPNDDGLVRASSQNGYAREYPSAAVEPSSFTTASIIKVITLRRRANTPLGFSIRGGWEHGTGVFVSEVIPGSIAQKQGLRVGDQIVRINGFSIHRAIHMEVLSLLKTCPGIVLKVKRVGILPVKERDKDPVTWKIVDPQSSLICPSQVAHSRVNGSTLENIIVKVEINVPGTSSLGCSIAKGPAELPGIFMCTVKEGGVADRAGLQVGDQILEMNGTAFQDLQLGEAVALMKSAKEIRLTVKKRAGISLFLDNASSSQGKHEDTISTTRSLSDGLSSSLKDRQLSGGSCSSKSEGSSSCFQSSDDSEKDYSISEESSPFDYPSKHQRGKWQHHRKAPSSASTTTTEDSAWIMEERRNLEESRRRLEEEKRRLEEEKRKLELEKTSSSSSASSQPPSLEEHSSSSSSRDNSFLSELQRAAAKMNTKENRDKTLDPLKSANRNDGLKGKRCKEDAIKRMQHEMLMEEFREAHRKMFGSQAVLSVEENISPKEPCSSEVEEKTPPTSEMCKLTIRNKKPPPPPPKSGELNKECQKVIINGQVAGVQSEKILAEQEVIPNVKEIIKEKEKCLSAAQPTNGFRVTVTEKGRAPAAPRTRNGGALVEVQPWTTRL